MAIFRHMGEFCMHHGLSRNNLMKENGKVYLDVFNSTHDVLLNEGGLEYFFNKSREFLKHDLRNYGLLDYSYFYDDGEVLTVSAKNLISDLEPIKEHRYMYESQPFFERDFVISSPDFNELKVYTILIKPKNQGVVALKTMAAQVLIAYFDKYGDGVEDMYVYQDHHLLRRKKVRDTQGTFGKPPTQSFDFKAFYYGLNSGSRK